MEKLRARLRGRLILPSDEGYDAARRIYNAMIDKRPAMIAECAGVADVITAVNYARENNLLAAVRGSGHNVAGNALCDDGMVIDLGPMKGVRVDPAARTARAQAGVTWNEFDRETQAFGLATTGGTVSTTGLSGLTLGGGVGWLARKHGLSCDNVLSHDVVTADGRYLTASATENPDLFWGLRGGGGNFGVVTSFEYRLHPVSRVLAGMLLHPLGRAKEVLRFQRDFARGAPDDLVVIAALLHSPDGVPMAAVAPCHLGPFAEAERALRPLREFGPPVADQVRPMSYCELQTTMLDAAFPPGLFNYWRSSFVRNLTDPVIDILAGHFANAPNALTVVSVEHLGGAVSRVPRQDTAFNLRDGDYNLGIITRWTDPAEADKNIRWARALAAALQPFSGDAIYVNYMAPDEAGRVKESYGAETYERLVAVKNRYDPTNFFRLNQNIKPEVIGV